MFVLLNQKGKCSEHKTQWSLFLLSQLMLELQYYDLLRYPSMSGEGQ